MRSKIELREGLGKTFSMLSKRSTHSTTTTASRPNENTNASSASLLIFCTKQSIHYIGRVDIEAMDRYARWRAKDGWAWIKEIELLRQFFEFCRNREWTSKNPARGLKRPILREANDIVPYT